MILGSQLLHWIGYCINYTTAESKRSKVEIFKEESNFIRYPLNGEMMNDAPNINEAATLLMKAYFMAFMLTMTYYLPWITALKFRTFVNYNLNVYFLRITATKVSKFANSGQNIEFRPFWWSEFRVKWSKICVFGLNLWTLILWWL